MKDFSGKTYEKTCRFYNVFRKYNSNWASVPTFTLWIFFSKIWWPSQFHGHFFRFPFLLRENLWKDLQFLWLIFKYSIMIYFFRKICALEICKKKMAALSKCLQFIIHFRKFEQHLQQKLRKDLSFFYIFSKYHFGFTSLQNLVVEIFFWKKRNRFQYVNKSFVIPATLNNILDKYYEKSFNSCNVFFKLLSIFTLSPNFMKTTSLQYKWQRFQCC